MIILFYFFFYTYTKSDLIGGMEGMYHMLVEAAEIRPVAGNKDGSYLTLKSNSEPIVLTCTPRGVLTGYDARWTCLLDNPDVRRFR